jgi:hypothetical protein
MSDGERVIDIPGMGDSDENARDKSKSARDGAADSPSDREGQRDATSTSRSDGPRTNVDDLDSSMGASRNQDYGEVM